MFGKEKLLRNECGATAIEYGLIAALIALACVGGMIALGGGVEQHYDDIENAI